MKLTDEKALDPIAQLCQVPEWECVDFMGQIQEWVRLTGRVVDTPEEERV